MTRKLHLFVLCCLAIFVLPLARPVFSQVTVEQALKLVPVQKGDVEYSIPQADEIKDCTISNPDGESASGKKLSGWIVKDPAGRLLRRFLDTNGDQDIDLWCYYRDGFEVYRDIDSNYDRKADQYRWYGSEGTRWGIDEDQDGRIDFWKRISAEEVSAEAAKAWINQNAEQFNRLLITSSELQRVGFSKQKVAELQKTLENTRSSFAQLLRQTAQPKDAAWLHFGGLRPGMIPEGTDGAQQDIVIYENVAALIRSSSKNFQMSLGTMIQVDGCWRLIDAPEIIDEQSSSSFASWYRAVDVEEFVRGGAPSGNSAYQALLEQFQKLDQQLESAPSGSAKQKIYRDLATTISRLALEAETAEDSLNWSRQFADTVTAAIQDDEFPQGLETLKDFIEKLRNEKKSDEAVALVTYRYINADFGAKLNDPQADLAVAQVAWLKDLKKFTEEFPGDENVPDAMMQLAMADEFEGKKEQAEEWYQTIAKKFSDSLYAEKARGAIRRLNSIGEKMTLAGTTLDGQRLDLRKLEGKVVLVHYWADWCEICKQEFEQLEALRKKYPDLRLVGINCDNDLASAKQAVAQVRVSWPQMHSTGGYNEGLAAEMGIVSLPSMILIDKTGKIVSTTVSAATLERELRTLLE